uniref:Uncharacterized protein n=1 Tax=Kalanchoe fedtschenkoi TaxID=63787 RepID=A0A7N0UJ35_KALFE
MNSMFSSFDFLCVELLGQSLKSSTLLAPIKTPCSTPAKQSGEFKKEKPKTQKKIPSSRFAVELDGLNCFETLVYS